MLQMVFLDFFEALLGCAEVYVVEASEKPHVTVTTSEQQRDITAVITDRIATPTPAMTHSLSLVEQVVLVSGSEIHVSCYVSMVIVLLRHL